MILGTVQPNGDAIISVRLRGPGNTAGEFQVMIDTGFNDWLALPRQSIESLGLVFREAGRYMLADGSEVASRLCLAEVNWFGQWRRILALEMEGGPLLGMAMVQGCHLAIDVVPGGRVEIQPLPHAT